jgi:hypothetical protein
VIHTTRSDTRRPNEWLGSTTMSQHIGIEPAVMASEIERLADLEGYLKIASSADWRKVRLRTRVYPFVKRTPPEVAPPSADNSPAPTRHCRHSRE